MRGTIRKSSVNRLGSFAEHVKQGPDAPFYGILLLYLLVCASRYVKWIDPIRPHFQTLLLGVCMAGTVCSAVCLIWFLCSCNVNARTCLLSGLILILTFWALREVTVESFRIVIGVYLALMAYGKRFRKIVQCYLYVRIATLFVALMGLFLGFSADRLKLEKYGTGHSLGMTHPNNWAQAMFLILAAVWYLYLRRKKIILTFGLFWAALVPVVVICKCRTIALFLLFFPFAAMALRWIEMKRERSKEEGRSAKARSAKIPWTNIWKTVLVAMPFLCLAMSFLLASQMELLQLTKGTVIYNMVSRFVQAGVALQNYGVKLFGQTMVTTGKVTAMVRGKPEKLLIMDNAYVTYSIKRGAIWMGCVLTWLARANRRCLQKRDCGLLLIALFMLLLGFMERFGLDLDYNFMFLYPLASTQIQKAENTE